MKKLLLLISVIFLYQVSDAQISNGTFENWISTNYSEPNNWTTGNQEAISYMGIAPVTEVNGISGSAVRMETVVLNGDTAHAYITNGDPMNGEGGVPFSQQVTAITGYYRYNLPANDSAILLVIFKNSGFIISSDFFKIKGTGTQNTFTSFSFPLSLPFAPDSVIIAAASSNLIDNVGIEAGSWLEIDDLAFSGPVASIPGSDFENWTAESVDKSSDWESYGQTEKTTDSYAGNFAIKLTTVDYGGGQIGSAGITNGQFSDNGPSTGGLPFTSTIDTLVGFYKYITSGSDSAQFSVSLSNNSNWVGGAGKNLPAAATYTYFEIPIYASNTPDTIRFDISSSIWPYSPSSAGSTLYLDNIALKSEFTLDVNNAKDATNVPVAFPSPANDMLTLSFDQPIFGAVEISVYDVAGRLIMTDYHSHPGNKIEINVSNLSHGIYYCNITYNGAQIKKAFSKS